MNGKYWDDSLGWVQGCSPTSPACTNCWLADYYYRHANNPKMKGQFKDLAMLHKGTPTCTGIVRTRPDRLDIPLKRKKPTVYAVWSDLFHEDVDINFVNSAVGIMSSTKQHTFLILTKRPERMKGYFYNYEDAGINLTDFISNVWIGVTAENQEQADKRIPILLQIPAAKRFVSIEPMLGPVDIVKYMGHQTHKCKCGWHDTQEKLLPRGNSWLCFNCGEYTENHNGLDAVILGGESGHKARPMHKEWAQSIRDQCKAAGVPFFFKNWGNYKGPGDYNIPAGRLIDGKEHNDLPWRE